MRNPCWRSRSAVLCAFGLHQVLTREVSRRRLLLSLVDCLSGVSWPIAAISLPAVLAAKAAPHEFYLSLAGAVAVLFAATLLMLGYTCRKGELAARTGWLDRYVLLLTCEMAGNYIYPVYYLLTRSATNAANPYRGAPYIDFLKANRRLTNASLDETEFCIRTGQAVSRSPIFAAWMPCITASIPVYPDGSCARKYRRSRRGIS